MPPVKLFLNYFEWISCQGGISPRGLRMACSIFIDRLRPGYEEHGVILPPDCTRVGWLPVLKSGPKEAKSADLVEAWGSLVTNSRTDFRSANATAEVLHPKGRGTVCQLAGKTDASRDDIALWFAIGLARFAGLRRGEIEACRG